MKLPLFIFAAVFGSSLLGRWMLQPGLPALATPMAAAMVAALLIPKARLTAPTCTLLLSAVAAGVLPHAAYLPPLVAAGCLVVSCSAVSALLSLRRAVGTLLAGVILIPLIGWPVLFSGHLPATPVWVLDTAVSANPFMALSAVARELPPWTELPAIYPRTSLGQDIGYVRPDAMFTVIGYGITGLVSAVWWARPRRPVLALPVSLHPDTAPTPGVARK